MILFKLNLIMLISLPREMFEHHIIPHIFNTYIKTIEEEHKKIENILHILNLICSCKCFSNIPDIWKNIALLIYPKNYSIIESSKHIHECIWKSCGWNWWSKYHVENNIPFLSFNYKEKQELWKGKSCPCIDISHYDINTLQYYDKDFIQNKNNLKKTLLSKLRSNTEKYKLFLHKPDIRQYRTNSRYIEKNKDKYNSYINKQYKSLIEVQFIEEYELKVKFIKICEDKLNYRENLLIRLNHTIDGSKNKKFNRFINFINSSKSNSDYDFYEYKNIWKNMTQEQKDLYKSV